MNTYTFSSKEELIEQAEKDDSFPFVLEWMKEQIDLEEILKEIPLNYRLWCLRKGYFQFLKHFDLSELDNDDLIDLFKDQPTLFFFSPLIEVV